MNSPNYNYPPFSSPPFRGPMSSTPTGNRHPRPRMGFAGPPSYPRPRSSAARPNPGVCNEDFSTPDGSMNSHYDSFDDSIRNNYGSPEPRGLNSFNAELDNSAYENDSFDSSGQYYSCNDTFTDSPQNNMNAQNPFPSMAMPASPRLPFQQKSKFLLRNPGGFAQRNRGSFAPRPRGSFAPRNPGSFSGQFNVYKKVFGVRPPNPVKGRMSQKAEPVRCEVCNITLNSQIIYETHIKGSKHAKKLKTQEISGATTNEQKLENSHVTRLGLNSYRCDLCMITVNSYAQMTVHLDGSKHKAKEKTTQQQIATTEELSASTDSQTVTESNGSSKSGGVRKLPDDFEDSQPTKKIKNYCEVCDITVNSDQQLQQHLTSKKHEAKVRGKPLGNKRRMGLGAKKGAPSAATGDGSAPTVVGVKTLASSFVAGETMQ